MRRRALFHGGAGFVGSIRRLEFQVLLDDLRHVLLAHFLVPETLGPDHHVRTEGRDIQTAGPGHANLAFEAALLGDLAELFDTTASEPL
jgi:hypothetical protein